MENSTPLTRCDTCHTVFEVPSAILDSVDSRVRCGECLQVFDASVNLHTANRPDFSLVDDTLVDGASESGSLIESRATEKIRQETATAAAGAVLGGAADGFAPENTGFSENNSLSDKNNLSDKLNLSDGIVGDRGHGARGNGRHDDTADESHLEATMSDFDLFSDDASLPEVSYEFGENTIDAIRLQFDSVDDVVDETLSDSLFPNDVTIDASGLGVEPAASGSDTLAEAVTAADQAKSAAAVDDVLRRSAKTGFVVEEGSAPETVEFDYREEVGQSVKSTTVAAEADTQATTSALASSASAINSTTDAHPDFPETLASARQPSGIGRYLLHGSLVLLTVALIAALYGYRERDNLADNPLTRPFLIAWCGIQGCPVPARFDKSQLKVVEKNIFSHPTLDDALVITVLLENKADFEQRYPALFLWLSDSARRTVASNEFQAAVYLPENGLTAKSVLAPGQQRRISIDVRDPGRRAVSLELSLR